MINIIMLVHNKTYKRFQLTIQALDSLIAHTSAHYRLLIIDDYSSGETADMLDEYADIYSKKIHIAHSRITKLGPGLARNIGIKKADQWGRGDALYLCDNDCYFLPGWDERLLIAFEAAKSVGFMAVGGYCHPFQQRGKSYGTTHIGVIRELEALGLLSWLMDWSTWDQFGPFDSAVKVNGSEDWAMCQKIRKAGGRVGVLEPAVVINCGITSSDNSLCPGAKHLYDQDIPAGVILK
jgi:glycosyltransferase involved in cell wall biosynthesis